MAGIWVSARARGRALELRLQRTTPRERLLLGGLILAALIYAPIAAIDFKTRQEDRYSEALAEQSAATLAQASARRVQSGVAEKAAIKDMERWGFRASNVAVAQVEIEQRLLNAATRAGLSNLRIVTDETIEVIGPTQWLNAEIQADLRWDPTFDFLDIVTGWPEGFRVKGFQYDIPQPRPGVQVIGRAQASAPGKLRLTLSFPVILEPVP